MSRNTGARSPSAKLRLVAASPLDQHDDVSDTSTLTRNAEEAELIGLELELAQERRQMRKELIAILVTESRNRPMTIPVRALRAAFVERDLTEEERERLRIAMAKADRITSAPSPSNDCKEKPR
jgi:hypothetical protein